MCRVSNKQLQQLQRNFIAIRVEEMCYMFVRNVCLKAINSQLD